MHRNTSVLPQIATRELRLSFPVQSCSKNSWPCRDAKQSGTGGSLWFTDLLMSAELKVHIRFCDCLRLQSTISMVAWVVFQYVSRDYPYFRCIDPALSLEYRKETCLIIAATQHFEWANTCQNSACQHFTLCTFSANTSCSTSLKPIAIKSTWSTWGGGFTSNTLFDPVLSQSCTMSHLWNGQMMSSDGCHFTLFTLHPSFKSTRSEPRTSHLPWIQGLGRWAWEVQWQVLPPQHLSLMFFWVTFTHIKFCFWCLCYKKHSKLAKCTNL